MNACHDCQSAERGTRTRYGVQITDSYCPACRAKRTREAQARFREREREALGREGRPPPWNAGKRLPGWFGKAVSEGKRARA